MHLQKIVIIKIVLHYGHIMVTSFSSISGSSNTRLINAELLTGDYIQWFGLILSHPGHKLIHHIAKTTAVIGELDHKSLSS
jgi:hypothetical protein